MKIVKKLLVVVFLVGIIGCYANAQSIIVNSDGTHSILINNGSTSTLVNPNGTHSMVINNGSSSIIVNPDGTHSLLFNNGSTSTLVNPNGTHSLVLNNTGLTAANYPSKARDDSEEISLLNDTIIIRNQNGTDSIMIVPSIKSTIDYSESDSIY